MTIHEKIARLRAAVADFTRLLGRKPVLLLDADGVIYQWDDAFPAYFHGHYSHLHVFEGEFNAFDLTEGLSPEAAAAVTKTMHDMDYSELVAYEAAIAVVPVLIEVGFDVAIATSHMPENVYSASAKQYTLTRDFGDLLAKRVLITQDKTRLIGDWLLDDKPSTVGQTDVPPVWEHVYFTQRYNQDLPGARLVWETSFDDLYDLVSAKTAAFASTTAPEPELFPNTGTPTYPWMTAEEPTA
ncbi:5' nucleotidase, NT5C type [Microbacterium gorillae]|uniref:5' nucleotidase, NT5C type n=1 Tax=Microbacterium gorillae TaxID=1231063 RepID=UPI0006944E73|nr:hypothetical protein [Microbacterium gorillae]